VPSTLVVCPSVTPARAERFCTAADGAIRMGADLGAVLVANSADTWPLADRWPHLVVRGSNAGFAASINQGAAVTDDFRWLVVANDDMVLAEEPADEPRITRLTDERWRRVPGLAGVFTNLSLVERVAPRLTSRWSLGLEEPSGSGAGVYPTFALVAISRRLWLDNDGMDDSLPFCYEDAWFVRRARASGRDVVLDSYDLGVHHHRSSTTTANIHVVLPVITWSALVYLRLIGTNPLVARAVCLAALLLRIPLSLAASADHRRHLVGIRRSLAAVLLGRRPSLPSPGRGDDPPSDALPAGRPEAIRSGVRGGDPGRAGPPNARP
jgi:hypothetical protein